MKNLLIFFTCISFSAIGQQPKNIAKNVKEIKPLCYLDSSLIEIENLYFDPNKIADVYMPKNTLDTLRPQGRIFIKSKEPKSFNFLTIADIQKKYFTNTSNSTTVFMLDNDFLKSIENFRVDSSYILKVEIINSKELAHLNNLNADFTILRIFTRTKENIEKQNRIRIRGQELTMTE